MDPFDFDDLTQPKPEPAQAPETKPASGTKAVLDIDWKIPFGILAGLFLLTLIIQVWSAMSAKTVRAAQLDLVDSSGRVRGSLAMEDGSPALTLFDENGQRRASLTVITDGPRLFLYDEKENWRVMMATGAQGPGVGLRDAEGRILHSAP